MSNKLVGLFGGGWLVGVRLHFLLVRLARLRFPSSVHVCPVIHPLRSAIASHLYLLCACLSVETSGLLTSFFLQGQGVTYQQSQWGVPPCCMLHFSFWSLNKPSPPPLDLWPPALMHMFRDAGDNTCLIEHHLWYGGTTQNRWGRGNRGTVGSFWHMLTWRSYSVSDHLLPVTNWLCNFMSSSFLNHKNLLYKRDTSVGFVCWWALQHNCLSESLCRPNTRHSWEMLHNRPR